MRVFMLLVALVFAFSIGYSRLVLGVHSLNQILFGLLLGTWLALSFHFVGYEWVMNHANELIQNKIFVDDRGAKFLKLTAITFSLFALLMAI
jgi:hypothetical protein